MDLLIRNGLILTMDDDLSIMKGSIAVEDGKIKKIGKNFAGHAEEVLDAEGGIVMPGLVLSHSHFQNVFHFLEDEENISPPGWSPLEESLTKEDVLASTTLACAYLLSCGVTFSVNVLSLKTIPTGLLEEVSKREEEMGMKGLVGLEIWDDEQVDGTKALREEERFVRKHDLRRIGCLASLRAFSSDEILECVRDLLLEKENMRLSVRISRTPGEYYYCKHRTNEGPLQRLERCNLLDKRTTLTHFTYKVTEEHLRIVQKNEASIVHTPLDYVYTGFLPPTKRAIEMGIMGGLGADDFFDIFEILRFLYLHQRMMGERIAASQLLEMVTRKAAQVWGAKEVGSIEVGKSADIIILDIPSLRGEHIYEDLLFRASSQKVKTVISSGRILKHEGKLLHVDEARLNREFSKFLTVLHRKIHGVAVG